SIQPPVLHESPCRTFAPEWLTVIPLKSVVVPLIDVAEMVLDRIEHVTAGADDFDQHLRRVMLGAAKNTNGRGHTCARSASQCSQSLDDRRREVARACGPSVTPAWPKMPA